MKFLAKEITFLEGLGLFCSPEERERNSKKKVIVGMSGGVDSSVAALLLLYQGYNVFGIFMKNWEDDDENCPAEKDYKDVELVSSKLGIEYYSVNFSKEYFDDVFKDFLENYEKGRTPNPDILCNSKIKFKVFFDYAKELGADYLATGHYANIVTHQGKTFLAKGEDHNKDQSYFLYRVPEMTWDKVLFPLGHIEKKKVRLIAEYFNLATSQKKDSTGICFIGEKKFRDFLGKYVKSQQGFFKKLNGEVVGEHKGQCFYTIGQRKGLGLGGAGEPWYVVKKDSQNNDVFVERGEHPALFVDDLRASDLIGEELKFFEGEMSLKCKVRYRQQDQDCRIKYEEDGQLRVFFDSPQRGVALGQSIVFYRGNICLGGGIIEEVGLTHYDKSHKN